MNIHQAKTIQEARRLAVRIANEPVIYADLVPLTYLGWVSELLPRGVTIHDKIKGRVGAEIRRRLADRLVDKWQWKQENEAYQGARIALAKELQRRLRKLGIRQSLALTDRVMRQHILRVITIPELTNDEEE